MIDISVIIVNYNVRELLEDCINSVVSSSVGLNVEIIIVDNNSYDGSINKIRTKYTDSSNIKIIENKSNVGFAKANNIGAREARGEYLLILNPDTLLREDTLKKCLEFYKSDKSIGVLGCKLVLPNGKLDLACRRSFPHPSVALYRIFGLSRIFPNNRTFGRYNLTYLDENSSYEVDSICGAFMMIRKDIFDCVNGFDEDYFMYGEDLDLCYKIKKSEHKVFYFAGTSIIHYKGESTKKSSMSYVSNFYGAMRIFVQKNLHQRSILLNSIIRLVIFYRAFLSYIKRLVKIMYPVLLDMCLIVVAMLISIKLRFEFFPLDAYTIVIIFYTIIWLLSLSLSGAYYRKESLSLIKPLNGILLGFFVNSSITYFFNEYAFSRVVILRTAAYAYILLIIWRLIIRMFNFAAQKNLLLPGKNTLIIGKNDDSEKFLNKLRMKVDTEYNIIGYISPGNNDVNNVYKGNLNNLEDIITVNKVRNIIFAKNEMTNEKILDLMWDLKNYNLNFKILSADSEMILGKNAVDKFDDIYLMQIEYNINNKFNIFVKRTFDILLSLICLFIVFPFALIYSKLFISDLTEHKFLKKLLLVPLVLKGELSFVGRATWDITSVGQEFLGKNGLTGLAQINYYKKLSAYEIEYYNFYYAKNQSLALDLEIILKTISLFLFSKKVIKL